MLNASWRPRGWRSACADHQSKGLKERGSSADGCGTASVLARGTAVDAENGTDQAGIDIIGVLVWIGSAAFIIFIGVPLVGAAIGFVALIGGVVLSFIAALLPFAIGLAVIAGVIGWFSDN